MEQDRNMEKVWSKIKIWKIYIWSKIKILVKCKNLSNESNVKMYLMCQI